MAGTKGFDPEQVLDAAMRTFWEHGYHATSAQDLVDATGIGRSSLYNTYSGKHDLYIRALRRYAARGSAVQLDRLSGPDPIRTRVRRLLTGVVDEEQAEPGLGCFVVNSVIELAPSDPEVAAVTDEASTEVVDGIHQALRAAQAEGDIAADKDAMALARFVHAQVGALRLFGRSGADRAAMMDVVETAVAAL